MDPEISTKIVNDQIEECQKDKSLYTITLQNEVDHTFRVLMNSSIDQEVYQLIISYDNFPEIPLLIDFIDQEGNIGTKKAYPTGNFFHNQGPCICNPCSRKAYKGYANLHVEWELSNWKANNYTGSLVTIRAILQAIYYSINNKATYVGRMEK